MCRDWTSDGGSSPWAGFEDLIVSAETGEQWKRTPSFEGVMCVLLGQRACVGMETAVQHSTILYRTYSSVEKLQESSLIETAA